MLASTRRRLILERVAEQQSIEAQALADELNVSVMTIRRDIKRLEQDGFLRQTYGGATVHITKSVELGFNSRALQFSAEKRLIGSYAANLMKPGQTLFLGEGTTTSQFAQFLPPHPHLLVITTSLSHASLLCSRKIRVVVVGGNLHENELIMTGSIAEATINRFYADICVLGAAGIDMEVGVTELDHEAAAIHRLMIERSRHVMMLADHSKLGFCASAVVAPVQMVGTLITDEGVSEEVLAPFYAADLHISLATKQQDVEREEQEDETVLPVSSLKKPW